jgi:hypothetical protein
MADIKSETEDIIVSGRLSFPELGEAQEFRAGDGKPRWSLTVLIDPGSASDARVRRAIELVAQEEWKDKAKQVLLSVEGQNNKYCYLDGNRKSYDGYAGKMALTAYRSAKLKNGAENSRPLLIDADLTPLPAGSGRIYAGCFVNVKVSFYCQSGENTGVRCSFTVVQYAGKGLAFSAGAPDADGFGDISAGLVEHMDAGADASDLI